MIPAHSGCAYGRPIFPAKVSMNDPKKPLVTGNLTMLELCGDVHVITYLLNDSCSTQARHFLSKISPTSVEIGAIDE